MAELDVLELTASHGSVQNALVESAKAGDASTVKKILPLLGREDKGVAVLALNNAVLNRDYAVMDALLEHGVPVDSAYMVKIATRDGVITTEVAPVLFVAAGIDAPELLERIIMKALEKGPVELDCDWSILGSPLIEALSKGLLENADVLLRHGADINTAIFGMKTALHRKASLGRMKNVQFLLDRGADGNAKDRRGHTPADAARENGHLEIAELIEARAGMRAGLGSNMREMNSTLYRLSAGGAGAMNAGPQKTQAAMNSGKLLA